MKNVRSLSTLLLSALVLTFASCKEAKKEENHSEEQHSEKKEAHDQRAHAMHEDQTGATFKDSKTATTFAHYLALKDALVKSDPALSAEGAQEILESTDNETLKEAANTIASSKSIEDQRKAFVTVTAEIEKMLQGALASGEVYKQYCPMAFDNTGGYWFSIEKQIMNPYFGDMMLHCGTVKETLQ